MSGLIFVAAFVVVALVAWYLFDDQMVAIRKHTREGREARIARGEEQRPPSVAEGLVFFCFLAVVFVFVGWLLVG